MSSAPRFANGIIIAAPRSGSGKTLVTLGLLAALKARGLRVAPAKTGPDYIDREILSRAAGAEAINLDPWAMQPGRLRSLAATHAAGADLLLIEGVMGLFDAAASGTGSTADLAATLQLPVILVVDAEKQAQSVAALVFGFAKFRAGVEVAGVIFNRVSTTRHERMLTDALAPLGIPVLGALPRRDRLLVPERHLGLVLPGELPAFETTIDAAAEAVETYIDLNRVLSLSAPIALAAEATSRLPPLAQRIAIARDTAFCFVYPHLLEDWRRLGAELLFFSPLADHPAPMNSEAVYLPGGYPELHGPILSGATHFQSSLTAARDRGALIYGECGGYMTLGEVLVDHAGVVHRMTGLLPIRTDISRPRRTLGYRRLRQRGIESWPQDLLGHEFHYSTAEQNRVPALFEATDSRGEPVGSMGAVVGRVMGSYAHVIDVA